MSDELSTITDPFAATALDEETELRALSQALRLAKGFKLIFVRCNQPQQQRKLAAALRAQLPGFNVQQVHFDKPVTHLLDELRSRIAQPAPDAVFVSGLEYSLPAAAEADKTPLVANLNASRNSFPQLIPCPLVLWIPEYILTAIMLGAPDFFSIRSGVYFFAVAPCDTTELAGTLMSGGEWEAANLSLAEKEERIEAIKSLLADYESLPADQRNYLTEMRLHERLGNLSFVTGNFSLASQHYKQALALAKKLEDHEGEIRALIGLGSVCHHQGHLAEAGAVYQQALALSGNYNARSNEGVILSSLGNVYWQQGRLDEAEKLYQQALEIFRENRDRLNEGSTLGRLARIYHSQNRIAEAESFHQQNLQISREHGDRLGEMSALINLGNTYLQQGRLMEAAEYYKQSLATAVDLGNLINQGLILNNLGIIRTQQGDLTEAQWLYEKALAMRQKIGDLIGQGITLRNLSDLWAQRGDLTRALELMEQTIEVLKATEDAQRLAKAQAGLAELQQAVGRQSGKQPHSAEEQSKSGE